MTDFSKSCAVVSLPDIELVGQISCARRQLVVIAPGFTERVATAIIEKWHELGPASVLVVVDPDPEVCRLGLGDLAALQMLEQTAEALGGQIRRQPGLRLGVIVTDETTTVYSPIPRLIETGGQPGERLNAIRIESSILGTSSSADSVLRSIDLHPKPLERDDVKNTTRDLNANPPVKFDLARKVRVFNARFEFVEFEMHGLSLARKRVPISSDLLGLAKEPQTQKLLRSSFQLINEDNAVSGDGVTKLKQFIVRKYLINLPGYGTVILSSNKKKFQVAERLWNGIFIDSRDA
jgi:hypothetical protein